MEGYCNEDTLITTRHLGNHLSHQKTSFIQRVDETLMIKIRNEQAKISKCTVQEKYLKELESYFGDVGARKSFAHTGSTMGKSIQDMMEKPMELRGATVDAIQTHVKSINDLYGGISNAQSKVKEEIQKNIVDINSFLQTVARLNQAVNDADGNSFTLLNNRRLELHEMAEKFGFHAVDDHGKLRILSEDSSFQLVYDNEAATLNYAQINGEAQITCNGFGLNLDITDYCKSKDREAEIGGLLYLDSVYFKGLQENLDNYASTLRDRFNAIHNLGTSLGVRRNLTGTMTIPGADAAQITNDPGSVAISGSGVLRLQTLTVDGVTMGHYDFNLSAVTNLSDLMSIINAQSSVTGITMDVTTESGRVSLRSTNGGGIAIGSVDGQISPQMSSGDGATTLGFSHFFGFNNLFDSGSQIYGENNRGVAGNLSVNAEILRNPAYLCVGKVDSHATPLAPPHHALAPGEKSVLNELHVLFTQSQLSFSETELTAEQIDSLKDFSKNLIDLCALYQKSNATTLQKSTFVYEGYSKEAARISKGDENDISLALMQNSQWYQSLLGAYKIINRLDDETLKLI